MARNSQQSQDAIIWQQVGLPLGIVGLDLRQPSDPRSLSKLLNARFRDERLLGRRSGYEGVLVQDGSAFPQSADGNDVFISLPMGRTRWVYGHGQVVPQSATTAEKYHHPVPGVARGVFRLDDSNVVWTGDRLLVVREDGRKALGHSAFWNENNDEALTSYGIPAYLPVLTDTVAPTAVAGDYVETCLTDTQRVIVSVGSGALTAWVMDRASGAVIDQSDLGGDDNPVQPRVFQSGRYVVCLWRDNTTNRLYINSWNGGVWTGASSVSTGVHAFDVAVVPGGFHLLRREGTALKIGHYLGRSTSDAPYAFNSTLTVSGGNPNGDVALAVTPTGRMCVVWAAADGLNGKGYDASLGNGVQASLSTVVGWDGGITICSRELSFGVSYKAYTFVVHASTTNDPDGTVTRFWEFRTYPDLLIRWDARWNTKLASKSFRVGDEVFCWLRSLNSDTRFLVAGAFKPQVCGIADREETPDVMALSMVVKDPLNEHSLTWARKYNTGNAFPHAGNARVGDLNFLPAFSAVQYGKSIYLAGSLVRNYDGVELGDAGFHDYPVITSDSQDTSGGGALTVGGAYQFRVYCVRYNKRGERFQGPAVTYSTTMTASNTRCGLVIPTVPVTNHDDIEFEVYRTEAGGTTFYLDGSITNDLTEPSVVYRSTMSDTTLRSTRPGDPHETGVAGSDELEELGPLGCAFLAASEDRLWGAGGQVPRGWVQFSKLKEQGEGAGFDAVGGYQEVDIAGGEVTSILGYGDSTIVFQRDRFNVIHGEGENNYGSGGFGIPELHLVDGAVNHAGTGLTQAGPVYWGVDGPRLIAPNFRVINISAPVRALTKTMTPSGVQTDLARQETIWFSENGTAVLCNLQSEGPRWAQWTGLKIAGVTDDSLVTTDGRLLKESPDAYGDDGVPFEFAGATAEIVPAQMFGADVKLGYVGIVGKYEGPHKLRVKTYYNGSPLWSDRWTWKPDTNSGHLTGRSLAAMTPAEIDALKLSAKNGSYTTHKKASRHDCRSFRVEWSDVLAFRPTYVPYEVSLEIGTGAGLGRVPVGTFTRS